MILTNGVIRFLIGLLIFQYSSVILSQEPLLFNVNKKNGLPSNCVYDVFVDNDGMRWYATDQGLYAYNGFQYVKKEFQGTWANSVTNLSLGARGTLWCRNFSDQVFILRKDTMVFMPKIYEALEGSHIRDMFFNGTNLVIVSEKRILLVNEANPNRITRIDADENAIIQSACLLNGKLYLGMNTDEIARVEQGRIVPLTKLPPSKIRFIRLVAIWNKLVSITEENNHLVVRQHDVNGIIESTRTIPNQKGILNAVVQNDQLCITTSIGAIVLTNMTIPQVIETGTRISDFCIDSAGVTVLASLDNGLYEIPRHGILIRAENKGKGHYNLIAKAPNAEFFVSDNSNFIWRVNADFSTFYPVVTSSTADIQFISKEPGTDNVYYTNGIMNKPLDFYFGNSLGFNKDYLLAGYHNGLYLLPRDWVNAPRKGKSNGNFFGELAPYQIRDKRVRSIFTHLDEVYVAFSDSLFWYQFQKGTLVVKKRWNIFGTDIQQDKRGNNWVASTNDGVYILNDGQQVQHLKPQIDLFGIVNKRVVACGEYMAILTEKGINIFEFDNTYGAKNIQFIDLEKTTVYDMMYHQGELLCTIEEGIISIPIRPETKPLFHNMIWKGIHLNGNSIDFTSEFEVPFSFRSLEFMWNNITYQSGVEFYYQVFPLQQEPQLHAGENSTVSFYSLPPGNYTVTLFSSLNGQLKEFSRIHFYVTRPWFWTWWFWTIFVLALFGTTVMAIRITNKRLRRKQVYKERLITSQLKAIRSQMNPHFLYNALNSLQGMIYTGKVNEAALYVSKFSDYLRQVLTNSEKQTLPLKQELESLRTYLELELERFHDDFSYDFDLESGIDMSITIPTMVIQPFVENAIKHGLLNRNEKGRQIRVQIRAVPKGIQVEVVDNGVGIAASTKINSKRLNKPQSFATKAIDERIQLINKQGEMEVHYSLSDAYPGNPINPGTKVLITFIFRQ